MKHTPGPWKLDLQETYEWPTEEIEIMDNDGDGFIAKVYAHTNIETQKANARLIAAAPDLLEALKELQKRIHAHMKMDVKKHYSLLVADAAASKAIHNAEGK